jgi:hypothetical protein
VLALALAVALTAVAEAPESVPRLALDVANPRRTGRHILHFEDLMAPRAPGAGARSQAARSPKALLVVAIAPGRRQKAGSEPAALAEAADALSAAGGMLVAVLLPGATDPDDPPLVPEDQRFLVVRDTFGLGRRRLGLVGPGHAIVFRSDGRTAGVFAPEPGAVTQAVRAALALLEEERR